MSLCKVDPENRARGEAIEMVWWCEGLWEPLLRQSKLCQSAGGKFIAPSHVIKDIGKTIRVLCSLLPDSKKRSGG